MNNLILHINKVVALSNTLISILETTNKRKEILRLKSIISTIILIVEIIKESNSR